MAKSASETGLPWQALPTPLTILSLLKGSVTPLRFRTLSEVVSEVVNFLPHSGHWRLRRMLVPSSLALESVTLESVLRQKGQFMS
jgi:hypothetical protein